MSGPYADVEKRFRTVFGGDSKIEFVRAPGRVNIIGEHTDYNGLSVLPMALDREIVIGVAARPESVVELTNVAESMPPVEFALSAQVAPYATGHWGNYVKAAAQALWEWAAANSPESLPLKGFRGCVGGSVPAGSGLSSSSALVVAAATALVHVNKLPISKPDLADLLAKGERYVGTEGGGMDQAVSILARKGYALKIDFFPLRTTPVKVPEGCSVVVANTLVVAKKTGGAREAYNTRVAECRLGLAMLKGVVRDSHPDAESAVLLRDFAEAVPNWPDALNQLQEVSTPKMRVRHVLTEGRRVELAARAMEQGDAAELGRLMDESHLSCARDYEISCQELDELVGALKTAGALGARLTGAGFGGCAVALVRSADVEQVLDGVWQSYYVKRGVSHDRRDEVLFACSPAGGAGVLNS
jgi:N-acetylgalactosamine kinase